MDILLAIPIAVAGLWVTAGVLADGLPRRSTARSLRRSSATLLALTVAGFAVTLAVAALALASTDRTVAHRAAVALALPAAPALVVAGFTVHRLRRLRCAVTVLSSAVRTPVPPVLRATAAHPMVAAPLQAVGLAAIPAAVAAAGPWSLADPAVLGLALTALMLAVVLTVIRHALRHSRLVERAISFPPSPRPVHALHVEQFEDRPGRLEPAVEPLGRRPAALRRQFQQQAA